MTLRKKILIAIVAANALTFAALAGSIAVDAAARRREDERRHQSFVQSTNLALSEKLLEEAGRVLDESVLLREVLRWPLWSLARDVILVNLERNNEYVISPRGAKYRRTGLSPTDAKALIKQARAEMSPILAGDGLAAPLARSEEARWKPFREALRDFVRGVATSTGTPGPYRAGAEAVAALGEPSFAPAPAAPSLPEAARGLLEPRAWPAIRKNAVRLWEQARLIGDPGSRTWGGIYVEPSAPPPPRLEPIPSLRSTLLIMAAGTAVIILVTYVLLSTLVLRPLVELEQASRRVARGDYSRPVPISPRQDEIAQVIASFNLMLRDVRDYHGHLQERIDEATERRKSAEQKLAIAQRLAATGKLASGISHEINNPLGGMINMSRSLLRRDLPEAKRREYLELIIQGLERIQETVKKVLQFSPREVKPQLVDLRAVLDRAVALVQHRLERQQVCLVREGPPEAISVFGDPHELQQVFLNLLINAVDALAEVPRRGELHIRCRASGHEASIAIADNGCGMTEEQLAQAFDLFYTTKPSGVGTGLGLAIVHNIVQNHGGRIELRIRRGSGTTVEITLPLASGPKDHSPEA